MLDSIITFQQTFYGQLLAISSFFILPLFAAIYFSYLTETHRKSWFSAVIFGLFLASSVFCFINEESFLKIIGGSLVLWILMIIESGFYEDLMESR